MAAGFERSLGATASRVFGAAGKIGGEVEGGGGGERDRARGRVRPGWLARPWPSPAPVDRRLGSRIFVAISGTGRGQRSRMAMTMSNAQRARISASAAGASGKTEKAKAAALAAAETGSPSPAQAFRLAARPFGSSRARSSARRRVARSGRGRGWAAGRRDRAIATKARGGPERSPTAKRRSRSAAFVGVEAQDLGGGGGALKRQAGAQRPGGGRVGAQECVEQREAGAGGEQRIALPCPSARPRPGWDRRRRWKGLPFRGFRRGRALLGRPRGAARTRSSGSGGKSESSRVRGESPGHGESFAALCHLLSGENPPRLSWGERCPIRLLYRT